MSSYVAEVLGTAGSPVLLLPGGAAPSRGFFPHLERALTDHRVVLVDRPGTGRAARTGRASLASGSAACAEVLQGLDAGPALVVGQSLGGALAVQVALDHPELVSGLVLVDPTPFNEPSVLRALGPMAAVLFAPAGLPVIGPRIERLLWHRQGLADELARQAAARLAEQRSLWWTSRALGALPEEGAALTARLRPVGVPAVLLTAGRKPSHKVRRAHDSMAAALGADLVTWPRAVHAEHLRAPDKVTDLVLSTLQRTAPTSPAAP